MSSPIRKQHGAKTKAAVALAMIKQDQTVAQICSTYNIHATQATVWKKQAIGVIEETFSASRKKSEQQKEKELEELYIKIGQLQVENDWLKKKLILLP